MPPNCGSIGPKFDCFPMTMERDAQAVIVPADIANCGTITRKSLLNIVQRESSNDSVAAMMVSEASRPSCPSMTR